MTVVVSIVLVGIRFIIYFVYVCICPSSPRKMGKGTIVLQAQSVSLGIAAYFRVTWLSVQISWWLCSFVSAVVVCMDFAFCPG